MTNREPLRPVLYDERADEVRLLDQRLLPGEERWLALGEVDEVVDAIRTLAVRGAPAIGVAAGYALACAARRGAGPAALRAAAERLVGARPTAVNLAWAVRRMAASFERGAAALLAEAHAIRDEDEAACRRIGALGAELLPAAARILTDGNAGWLMQRGEIGCAVVGADRIAANGDVANKIGTYSLAVLARHHGLPFYVAAPWSTVDLATARGDDIPIEERPSDEVVMVGGVRIAPVGVTARYPAFDVTPAALVTAIITERGVVRAPHAAGLAGLDRAGGG